MSGKRPAIHPGKILREDFMKPLGLSSNALARALDATPAPPNATDGTAEIRALIGGDNNELPIPASRFAKLLEPCTESG
jgi:plasmid maintenance system antidote protein VapI